MYLLLSNRDGVVVRGKLSEPRHLVHNGLEHRLGFIPQKPAQNRAGSQILGYLTPKSTLSLPPHSCIERVKHLGGKSQVSQHVAELGTE